MVPVALRRTITCASCKVLAEIVIKQPPLMSFDIAPWESFESPATGKAVTSRKQMQEDLRASGCHIREPGEEKDTARRRAEIAAERDRKIETIVAETAQGLGL